MTEIEVAKSIVKKNGICFGDHRFDCDDCPAKRIRREKGLESCEDLWYGSDNRYCIKWFENWLSEDKK